MPRPLRDLSIIGIQNLNLNGTDLNGAILLTVHISIVIATLVLLEVPAHRSKLSSETDQKDNQREDQRLAPNGCRTAIDDLKPQPDKRPSEKPCCAAAY